MPLRYLRLYIEATRDSIFLDVSEKWVSGMETSQDGIAAHELEEQLAQILESLCAANEMVRRDADLRTDSFGAIGLTSVDYLEFILNVETELNIDVPDEALMDPALASVRLWADYLARHRDELATPLVGAATA